MYSKKIISVRFFYLGILLFLAARCCFAQNSYPEIELYRSLIDKETRDSSYHKALAHYHASAVREIPLTSSALQKRELNRELSALTEAFIRAFWDEPRNYSEAFVLAVKLKQRLAEVNDAQFPGRRNAYVKLGEAYYIFRDYAKSIELLAHVIDEPPLSFADRSHLEALRISGICYANMPGRMQQSDSCFMAMMLSPDRVLDRPVYDALALSNLGCNAMLQGDFDKALALDLEVLPRLKQEKDYGHIAGMYSCQGFSYLGKSDYKNLRIVIDSISFYAHKDNYNRSKRLKQAYTLSSKYYSAVGDAETAQLYTDSLVALYLMEEQDYTSQFISDARREVRDQEIAYQRQEIIHQKNLMILVLIILVILSIGMILITQLYRRRNAAYKVLARKADEWARTTKGEELAPHLRHGNEESINKPAENGSNDCPTDEDRRIMALIEREMSTACAYREISLTAEGLAARLEVHRNALSHAVNRITGGNFKNYINGYRIKEAVRIISETDRKELYVDELYEQVGFGNRSSFYRSFKQFTGLSPIEYQKNKGGFPSEDDC